MAYICQLSYACEHASSVDYCHLRCGGCLLCNQHKRANSFKPESSGFDRQHLAAHSAATKLTEPVLSESKETPLANGPSQALEPVRRHRQLVEMNGFGLLGHLYDLSTGNAIGSRFSRIARHIFVRSCRPYLAYVFVMFSLTSF
ncbi:unnamed protein product [Protopolystoma xenopodis]|uniref:Uncharacterized protein n=1 Tax=Protopolystoma xenopodis TaxID=117903 RepID=A0A448XHM4_9PLAT|nr:unnamed protein product [Protopolystoma xenopodis]